MLARVGLDLGSVEGHMAQLYQTRLLAQQQGLREQPRQGLQMALAELREGVVIRMCVRRQVAERHVVVGLGLHLARTVNTRRVAIQKNPHHHRRRVRRHAAAILRLIRGQDRAQIQRRNNIHKKPRQMTFRKPIVQRRRE